MTYQSEIINIYEDSDKNILSR